MTFSDFDITKYNFIYDNGQNFSLCKMLNELTFSWIEYLKTKNENLLTSEIRNIIDSTRSFPCVKRCIYENSCIITNKEINACKCQINNEIEITDFIPTHNESVPIEEDYAKQLLSLNGIVIVEKVCRARSTWSIIIEAKRQNKKILLIFPTNKLCIEEMNNINEYSKTKGLEIKMLHYGNNKMMCKRIPEDEDDLIFPYSIKFRCKSCSFYNRCKMTNFMTSLRKQNYDVIIMTYKKLEFIQRIKMTIAQSQNYSSETLDFIQRDIRYVLFDECNKFIDVDESRMTLGELIEMRNHAQKIGMKDDIIKTMNIIISKKDQDVIYIRPLGTRQYFSEYENLHEMHEKGIDVGVIPKNLIFLCNSTILRVGEKNNIVFKGQNIGSFDARRNLINSMKNKTVIFNDATLMKDQLLDLIDNKKIINFIWGDPYNITRNMLLISDNTPYYEEDMVKDKIQKRLRSTIDKILMTYGNENVRVTCINKEIYESFKDSDIKNLTYYRSSESRGVQCNQRIMIVVSGSFSSFHSYDYRAITSGKMNLYREDKEKEHFEKLEISKCNSIEDKESENSSSFIQEISRIIDPSGEYRSVVFCIGTDKESLITLTKQWSSENWNLFSVGRKFDDFCTTLGNVWLNKCEFKDLKMFYNIIDDKILGVEEVNYLEKKYGKIKTMMV